MDIIDRLRSMLGGSKTEAPGVEPEAVTEELAIEDVQRDLERARERPLSGEFETPGASDGSALR